jgi:hypothetical protein
MEATSREESIRKFGTNGIMLYVHLGCREKLLERIAREGKVIQPDRNGATQWKPDELIGRYKDINHCDECGGLFQATDEGYVSYWATTADELAIWERVKEKDGCGHGAESS